MDRQSEQTTAFYCRIDAGKGRGENQEELLALDQWDALYCRLSRDDEGDGDSNSIAHQKAMLEKYARDSGITRFKFYVDDGYSGTTFNRPGFQQMLADWKPGIINEWYAKDNSKKIRAAFRAKGLSGKPLTTHAPFGYLKEENGGLVLDPETAPIVKWIFQLAAEGNGTGRIARLLCEAGVPMPTTLAFRRKGSTHRYDPEHPNHWYPTSITRMLSDRVYKGDTVNFKTTKKILQDI